MDVGPRPTQRMDGGGVLIDFIEAHCADCGSPMAIPAGQDIPELCRACERDARDEELASR